MSRRQLLTFLILEIVAVIHAALAFRMIPSRLAAGTEAGCIFIAVGSWIVAQGLRQQAVGLRYLSFWLALVQVLAFSLPMLALRWLHQDIEFSQISYFGLSGPQFHHLSEAMYLLLIVGTAIDLAVVHRGLCRKGRTEINPM